MSKLTEKYRIVTNAIITNRGKILLGKKEEKEGHPISGEWHFPGGHIDKDEEPEEAIIREVKEETGLDCKVHQLVDVTSNAGLESPFQVFYHLEAESRDAKPKDDLEQVKWLERVGSGETVGEMLDYQKDGNESYTASLAKSIQVEGILTDRISQLENERSALSHEIVETVDKYTEKLYEEAINISERLGGTKRKGKGEFDILRELSDSRRGLVSRNSKAINKSSVVSESNDALKYQSKLVNEYLTAFESRKDGIEELYKIASENINPEMLEPVQDRANSIKEGLDNLSSVVNGQDYDSVREAVDDTIKSGMIDLEMQCSDNQRVEEVGRV